MVLPGEGAATADGARRVAARRRGSPLPLAVAATTLTFLEWRAVRATYTLEASRRGATAACIPHGPSPKAWGVLREALGCPEADRSEQESQRWDCFCASLTTDSAGRELRYLARDATRAGAWLSLTDAPRTAKRKLGEEDLKKGDERRKEKGRLKACV